MSSLVDRLGWWSPGAEPDYRRFAPIAVYGTVSANVAIGHEVIAARIRGMRLQRRRVTLRVEGYLRGEAAKIDQDLRFDYYAAALPSAWRFHKRTFEASAGARYLFFLFEEDTANSEGGDPRPSGQLHAIGDVGPFSRRIHAGRPPSQANASDTSDSADERRFAELFLKPDAGLDEELFVLHLGETLSCVRAYTGSLVPFRLLRDPLVRPEPSIRKEACAQLMSKYDGQWDC